MNGRKNVETYIKAFLRKFIASLFFYGVNKIPFSDSKYKNGIESMQKCLKELLSDEDYWMLSDLFTKVPVQETYAQSRDFFMSLNGDVISFAGPDNPSWTQASIRMTPYYANKLLKEDDECNIKREIIDKASKCFCDGAGVITWEKF